MDRLLILLFYVRIYAKYKHAIFLRSHGEIVRTLKIGCSHRGTVRISSADTGNMES
jgi:hypothetical protein